MTDRFHSLIVVLKEDTRTDGAVAIEDAI